MAKTYLIELPESDEIGYLVEIMARFAQADHRFITSLETTSLRLAQSVASLTGKKLLTESLLTAQEGIFLPSQVVSMSWGAEPDAKESQEKADIPAGPAEDPDAAVRKPCKMCGKPSMKRSTICGRPECKRERQRRWDAAWKEKNSKATDPLQGAEAAAAESPVSEAIPVGPLQGSQSSAAEEPAAGDLPPFQSTSMIMRLNRMMLPVELLSFEQLTDRFQAGTLPAGSMFQDVLSGQFYEVHQGPVGSTGMRFEQVDAPGQAEKQPA